MDGFVSKKEMLEEFFKSKGYVPMKFKEMASLLQVPKMERDNFRLLLNEMIKEGKLIENGEGRYEIPGADMLVGTFMSTKKGFGFLRVSENEDDIYIPGKYTGNAFDGDTVTVKLLKDSEKRGRYGRGFGGERSEGRVTGIIKRAVTEVVGTFDRSRNFGFVVPDNVKFDTDIYIPKSACKNVPKGYKVVAKITDYGSDRRSPEGKIVEIIGDIRDKGVDILSVARAYGIEDEFKEEVLKEAEKEPQTVSDEECGKRLDLREIKTVTIDGEDAKDLDDAISVVKELDGSGKTVYRLGVHIADVSHYVKEGSVLDREALNRGTSVYLADKVIPMLPKELSNGICSLNENEDRLTLSCLMDINEDGEIISHKIAETVIKTAHRMNYSDANKIITGADKGGKLKKRFKDVYEMLIEAEELALILRKRRQERGSIDFDFPETKITLDENGKVLEINAYDRNEATRLIEDFMLAANETVAEDSFWQEIPFVYRNHDNPSEEKIKELGIFINNFGYSLRKTKKNKAKEISEIHPKDVRKLLDSIAGTDEETLISRMTLRSLKRAKYTTSCDGHFGLAAKYYCHFTSPIRRYPDLQVHRIIKENLNDGISEERTAHYAAILDEVALRSSMLERRADDAEREVDKMKAAEYMAAHIGEEFDGVISGITSWGIYVELPNTVEGMIRLASIDGDTFVLDSERMEIVGRRTGEIYRLGQSVRVRVESASKELRTVDFEIVKQE